MRILIHTFGSRGDVQPYVALGAALAARGHEITVTTGQGFDDLITAHGLVSRPCSVNFQELLDSPEIREAMRSFRGKLRAFKLRRAEFGKQFDEQLEIARDVAPDLQIVHPKGMAAVAIGEHLGIATVPTSLQPGFFAPTAAFPHFLLPFGDMGPTLNRFSHRLFDALVRWGQRTAMRSWARATLGRDVSELRPFTEGFVPGGGEAPRLFGYSRHIVPKPEDWPVRDHVTGYWFTEPDRSWKPPAELTEFLEAGPPPVYIGFGSMPADDPAAHTRAAIAALSKVGARGVLATGWGGLGGAGTPETVFTLKSAPHDWLFPRCAAIVHHGGAGTTHEALRWGKPAVICPFIVDQPFWARRLAHLGVAAEPLPAKKLTADRLAERLRVALSPAMAERAQGMGEELRAEDGASQATEIVCDAMAEMVAVKP